MSAPRAAVGGDSKRGNENVFKDKGVVDMAPKEGSQRQVNKKLVELLLTEAEETGAIFTVNKASLEIPSDWEGCGGEEISRDRSFALDSKCRTCSQYLMLNETVKDLYDKRNTGLLHHIKVLTGVWIQQGVEGLPHHICESCQDTLKKAIEFRDNCIKANIKLNQGGEKDFKYGFKICDDDIESELENVLYEESSQHISRASEMELSDLEFDFDSEDDSPLVGEESSRVEDVVPVEETEKKTSREREHVCREIASIIKCETKEVIGKVDSEAAVYKVVLSECNREEETKKPSKYSFAVPKPKKPKLSSEEKKEIRRLRHQAKPFSYVCDKCGHSFRMPDQLQMHLLRHNQTKNFACPECPRKFYNSYLRNMHLRERHRGEKPWSCNYCNKSFSNGSCRQKHERQVHGAGPRISVNRDLTKVGRQHCSQCAKSFSSKSLLAWHMNTHTGERPFKCEVCSKGFASPPALKRHEVSHDKLPFHCEICLKGFLLRCQLKDHQVVHTGERPYWCELCDVYCRSRYTLDKHKKSDMHKNKMLTEPEDIEAFPNTITDILSDFHENNVFITQEDQEEELEGLQFTLTDILGY